ncbi:DUF3769 domain-containing protein [Gloeocapsopsis crepidinum LEGE 06123]|uniref:DUF3769 domain-containing protein n=1 Tax=Gloeocapsopsis crepidinum LEGE 06123 TaxID=588587 RepID=A0ABR9UU51_9CHRO|nr:DUF3769 domain-containing protein [Gloeocapsopsis crepidinum]MBE9191794.1 DUF3769 domain-containing protein [Gloeocapsopsis crepidinum LEGE 06123]
MTHAAPPPEPHHIVLPSTAISSHRQSSSSVQSQFSAAKDATLLGETISIGYPIEQNSTVVEASSDAIPTLDVSNGNSHTIAKLKKFATETTAQLPENSDTNLPTLDFSAPAPTAQEPVQTTPHSPSQPLPQQAPRVRDRVVELNSNYQEYDAQRQIVTAEGDVLLRYDGTVLDADRLQVNLENLIGVGEGNVALTRGQQIIRGDRFTYNLVQDRGNVLNASGEVFIPTAREDFTPIPTDVTAGGVAPQPLSDRISANQPLQKVTSPGGINIGTGSVTSPQQGGEIRRLRVEADTINFYPEGWQATNVRITNDPFSPPELELRADTMTLIRETPSRDRIRTTGQRLVFDQGLSIPIPRNEQVIDRRQRQVTPGLVNLGYDSEDRGGLFVERSFNVIDSEAVRVSVTPQVFVQQAITESGGNIFSPDLFGVRGSLDATLGPQTTLTGLAVLPGLTDIGDNLRASLRLRTPLNILERPHGLTLEYSYRDRLYNGSLGYQTVRSSLGGIVTSPVIPLGDTGFNLSYQAGAQYITANTDRIDLLEPIRDNNRVSLGRLQGSAALSRGFLLWRGTPLPATATQGLRYTPTPVIPYVQLYAGVRGDASFYSSGDQQTLLTGTVGIQGQFGHFSRPFLDYTGFNIAYSQGIRGGTSPFLFDRAADRSVLSVGITQQIYGPFRLGVQTSINVNTGRDLSTDYVLEYSRRTYGVVLRYNPTLELGSLTLRISDFNWVGGTDPFSGSEVRPVLGGVRQE